MGVSTYFTTAHIAKLGIKRERLKDWIERGYIKPSIEKTERKGGKNKFSLWDLYEIKLFEYLVKRGFLRSNVPKLIQKIADLFVFGNKGKNEIFTTNWITLIRNADGELLEVRPFIDADNIITLNLNNYPNGLISDILLINFKEIRDQVHSAIK